MNKKVRLISLLLAGAMLAGSAFSLTGCSGAEASAASKSTVESVSSEATADMVLSEEEVPLSGAVALTLTPEASGKVVYQNGKTAIDASNASEGYVMIKYLQNTSKKIKVLIKGPSGVQYTYDLNKKDGSYEVFPLSDGSGTYSIGVYENISGTKYSTVLSKSISVKLSDEFGPFLYPNQYVNFSSSSKAVKKAGELVQGKATELEKVTEIYNFVINNLTYDTAKAKSVKSGYLPDIDAILASKKGICFDYASLMAAMLRSQGIPTKLVIGYTGSVYHAWINIYTDENGWVNNVISFDGHTWKLMDPTFASSNKSSKAIMKYIGTGSNYQAKYLY